MRKQYYIISNIENVPSVLAKEWEKGSRYIDKIIGTFAANEPEKALLIFEFDNKDAALLQKRLVEEALAAMSEVGE